MEEVFLLVCEEPCGCYARTGEPTSPGERLRYLWTCVHVWRSVAVTTPCNKSTHLKSKSANLPWP